MRSNAMGKAFPRQLNANGAALIRHPAQDERGVGRRRRSSLTKLKLSGNLQQSSSLFQHEITWETDMLKGGLLWLIGIPLPIILILFFMGWLS